MCKHYIKNVVILRHWVIELLETTLFLKYYNELSTISLG